MIAIKPPKYEPPETNNVHYKAGWCAARCGYAQDRLDRLKKAFEIIGGWNIRGSGDGGKSQQWKQGFCDYHGRPVSEFDEIEPTGLDYG